jgi:hypothetical protein
MYNAVEDGSKRMSTDPDSAGKITPTHGTISGANHLDHLLARCGIRRTAHRVQPGLYALGHPDPSSPVFVTANYTLSFDALRSALGGRDGYILVLDTRGINVWCAAGEGTFGTEELVHRVESAGLSERVQHRRLIVPQLGAPGVAAHEVKRRTGFAVEYGPVRAADLPHYLSTGQATPEMRRVTFRLRDRLVLIPVEVVHLAVPVAVAAIILYLVGSPLAAWASACAILAGVVAFPILLPWLPTHDFSTKGFVLGFCVAVPFALAAALRHPEATWWQSSLAALSFLLTMTPVTAFLALNFTGSTPFTSRSGVRREIFAYVPAMAGMLVLGAVAIVASALARMMV